MYTHKTFSLIHKIFPDMMWRAQTEEKVIYLTFDDGPIPEITEFVLDTLADFDAKATFFCVGDNVRKYPEIFQSIIAHGHSVGNHTFNHLDGWKTEDDFYLENVEKCEDVMNLHLHIFGNKNVSLFRPPYGKIGSKQSETIKKKYKIVMWDVLTGDFDTSLSPEKCFEKSIKWTEKGSIVTFHDSIKAFKNMSYTLPRYLEHFKKEGYIFKALESEYNPNRQLAWA